MNRCSDVDDLEGLVAEELNTLPEEALQKAFVGKLLSTAADALKPRVATGSAQSLLALLAKAKESVKKEHLDVGEKLDLVSYNGPPLESLE